MSAFSIGFTHASVIHRNSGHVSTWDVLTGIVPFTEDSSGLKVFLWHQAVVTKANEQRAATLLEMAQIARFVDFNNTSRPAATQLSVYVHMAANSLAQTVSMASAA